MRRLMVVVMACVLLFSSTALAHPGGLDSAG